MPSSVLQRRRMLDRFFLSARLIAHLLFIPSVADEVSWLDVRLGVPLSKHVQGLTVSGARWTWSGALHCSLHVSTCRATKRIVSCDLFQRPASYAPRPPGKPQVPLKSFLQMRQSVLVQMQPNVESNPAGHAAV